MPGRDLIRALLSGDFDARPADPEEAHSLRVARLAHAEDWEAVIAASAALPDRPALRGLVLAHRAAALLHRGDPDKALELLRGLARLPHPGVRGLAHRLLGGALAGRGQLEEARHHLEQALKTPVEPERRRARRDLGVLLSRLGDHAGAEAHAQAALAGSSGVLRALALGGLACAAVRRLAAREALDYLEEALALPAPRSEQACFWRTRHAAHLLRGEAAQAAYALERAQALGDGPDVRGLRVHLLRLTGQPSAALRQLEESTRRFPGDSSLSLARAALLSGRDPEQALAILEGLEPPDPADGVRAGLFEARALHALGRLEGAFRRLRRAAQEQARHPLPLALEAAHLSDLYAWGLLHGLSLPLAWEGIAVRERPSAELRLEGSPGLRLDGREVGLPPLAFALLGFLWLQGGQCAWEKLAMALWPDAEDPGVLRSRLDNALSRLRRKSGLPLVVLGQGVCRFSPELALEVAAGDRSRFLEGCYLDWAVEVREQDSHPSPTPESRT